MNEVRNARRFLRLATGAAMIAAAPFVLTSVAIKPADDGSASVALANLASHASAQEASLLLGLIAIGLLIPATFGLMRIAQRRSPVLAFIGGALTLLGWVAFTGMQALGAVTLAMAVSQDRAAMTNLYDQIGNSNVITVIQLGFILGHVAGVAVLGLAVARSRVAPIWIGVALAVSGPLHFAAHAIDIRSVDLGAFAMLALGYAAGGVVLLRMKSDDAENTSVPKPKMTTAPAV